MNIHVTLLCLMINIVTADNLITNEVENVIRESLKCRTNPGMAISIVKNGRTVIAKGFGFKDVETKEEVTNMTLFGIASLSKAFAATVLVKILETHKNISLNTKLAEIFEDENIFADSLRSKYTTLEDLLAHRVGLPSNNKMRYDTELTRDNLVKRLRYLKAHGEFRDSFYYSNILYGLITYITEKVGGNSWEDLVQMKLFQPLGMASSDFSTTVDPSAVDLAKGYFDRNGELIPVPFELSRRWGMLCGSGCVLSNAIDMAKWMMFHLNGGRNQDGRQVVGENMLAKTHKVANHISYSSISKYTTRPKAPVTRSQDNYAMGWRRGYYRGYQILTHTGSTYGYRAMLTLFPASKLGIFTVITGDDNGYLYRTALHMYLADKFLGELTWLNASTLCSFPEPWNKAKTPVSEPKINKILIPFRSVSNYTGTFTHPAYGSLVVTKRSKNGLTLKYGWAEFELYPKSSADSFYGEAVGLSAKMSRLSTFYFNFDRSLSSISSVTIPVFESKIPPVFKRKIPPVFEKQDVLDLNPIKMHSDHGNSCCALLSVVPCLTIVLLVIQYLPTLLTL